MRSGAGRAQGTPCSTVHCSAALHMEVLVCGIGQKSPRAGQGGDTQQQVPLLFSSAFLPLHFPIWHSSDGSQP